MFVQPQVEFDLSYTDTAFISLSTNALLNYPFPGFAKLPLSLVISLELFSCKVGIGFNFPAGLTDDVPRSSSRPPNP